MKAVCVHHFGGPEVLTYEEIPRPVPGPGQVLVRVQAAGVGPWDAWVRSGKSAIPQPLPLVPGSDLAGIVAEIGPGVSTIQPGDPVFGVTNARFTGAYAEYALAEAAMIARKPAGLGYVEAASVPVVATTAWQMVYEYGQVSPGQRVLVHGAAGSVGAYVVQFAREVGAEVIGTAHARDLEYVRSLGASRVIDPHATPFEESVQNADVVLDTVGGEVLTRSFAVLKPGGVLVSSAAKPDDEQAARHRVRGIFFLVSVTTERLTQLAGMLDSGQLKSCVGERLPLAQARLAHEMLEGKPHRRGKIVLTVDA